MQRGYHLVMNKMEIRDPRSPQGTEESGDFLSDIARAEMEPGNPPAILEDEAEVLEVAEEQEAPILEVAEEENTPIKVGDTFTVKENVEFRILEKSIPKFMVSITDKDGNISEYIADELEIEDAVNGLMDLSAWELIRGNTVDISGVNTTAGNQTTSKKESQKIQIGNTFTLSDGKILRIEERNIPTFMVAVQQGTRPPKEYIADELEIEDAKNGLMDFTKWELIHDMSKVKEYDPGTIVFYDGSVCNIEETSDDGLLKLFNPTTGKHYKDVKKQTVTVLRDKDGAPQSVAEIYGAEKSN